MSATDNRTAGVISYSIECQRSTQHDVYVSLYDNERRGSCAVHLNALLDGLEALVARRASRLAEGHLGDEIPGLGDVPRRLDLLVNEGVVVLQGIHVSTTSHEAEA